MSVDESIADLPPSAKLAYVALMKCEPATQKDLVQWSKLPDRTVRDALDKLKREGVVNQRPNPTDARQSLYFLNTDM